MTQRKFLSQFKRRPLWARAMDAATRYQKHTDLSIRECRIFATAWELGYVNGRKTSTRNRIRQDNAKIKVLGSLGSRLR